MTGRADTHRCPGPRCGRQVRSGVLACPQCWNTIPKPLRDAIWRSWNRGRGKGSPAHTAAIAAAASWLRRQDLDAAGLTECGIGCGQAFPPSQLAGHEAREHSKCQLCGAEPRGRQAVIHDPDCPRLLPGHDYSAEQEGTLR